MAATEKTSSLERLTQEELDAVLKRHQMYRTAKMGGARAVLSFFDLSGLDFSGQDLTDADLTGARLTNANMKGAVFD